MCVPEIVSNKAVFRPIRRLKSAGKLAVFVASSLVNCGALSNVKIISLPKLVPTILSKVTAPSRERCKTIWRGV